MCALGTCGDPKLIELDGQDSFAGQIVHSSQLDDADLEGKKVVIIGSGASGVEAAELAVAKKARDVVMLARSDKWVIPRNTLVDILLSLQPFGREMVRGPGFAPGTCGRSHSRPTAPLVHPRVAHPQVSLRRPAGPVARQQGLV